LPIVANREDGCLLQSQVLMISQAMLFGFLNIDFKNALFYHFILFCMYYRDRHAGLENTTNDIIGKLRFGH
jgi:hypothetical protein